MTTYLEVGQEIPRCRPRTYKAYTVYFGHADEAHVPEKVSEDDGDTVTFEREGVLIRSPRKTPELAKPDRITFVETFYPWHRVTCVTTEVHSADKEHDWSIDTALMPRRYVEAQPAGITVQLGYPLGLGAWCEGCDTARPLTEDEQAEVKVALEAEAAL